VGSAVSEGEREGGGDDGVCCCGRAGSGVAVLSFLACVFLAFFFDLETFFAIGAGASSSAATESRLALRFLSLFLPGRWGVGKCIVWGDPLVSLRVLRGNWSDADQGMYVCMCLQTKRIQARLFCI
jgi:hypothetical protein